MERLKADKRLILTRGVIVFVYLSEFKRASEFMWTRAIQCTDESYLALNQDQVDIIEFRYKYRASETN